VRSENGDMGIGYRGIGERGARSEERGAGSGKRVESRRSKVERVEGRGVVTSMP